MILSPVYFHHSDFHWMTQSNSLIQHFDCAAMLNQIMQSRSGDKLHHSEWMGQQILPLEINLWCIGRNQCLRRLRIASEEEHKCKRNQLHGLWRQRSSNIFYSKRFHSHAKKIEQPNAYSGKHEQTLRCNELSFAHRESLVTILRFRNPWINVPFFTAH